MLEPGFAAFLLHNELHIDGRTIRFPNIPVGTTIEPADWFPRCHRATPVHEPALVAWLYNLREAVMSEEIAFFDIGAAFGYFSCLAAAAFAGSRIYAVEPNRSLAEYVARVARHNKLSNIVVINQLVGDRDTDARLKARNFAFLPDTAPAPDGFADVEITMTTLGHLLGHADSARPVLKIDVEGWQARMLPPAMEEIVRRGSVVFLECDTPEKMSRFNATNSELAELFLERDYRLFVSDHRQNTVEVHELSAAAGAAIDCDVLLAMIPPDIVLAR